MEPREKVSSDRNCIADSAQIKRPETILQTFLYPVYIPRVLISLTRINRIRRNIFCENTFRYCKQETAQRKIVRVCFVRTRV